MNYPVQGEAFLIETARDVGDIIRSRVQKSDEDVITKIWFLIVPCTTGDISSSHLARLNEG